MADWTRSSSSSLSHSCKASTWVLRQLIRQLNTTDIQILYWQEITRLLHVQSTVGRLHLEQQQLITQLQAINLGAETVDQTVRHHRYSNFILTRDHLIACAINCWPTALGAALIYRTAGGSELWHEAPSLCQLIYAFRHWAWHTYTWYALIFVAVYNTVHG